MRKIAFLFVGLLAPALAFCQSPSTINEEKPITPVFSPLPNALTMQVVMAQRPASISEEKWRAMMLNPVGASLIPIRITQAMLDTIDGKLLDLRYQYVLVSPGR
ncbi:MAG: hypothetical protein LKM36_03640 [Flavobacteriales bacterium]|jgi:hypothetical protein|nr:hypothetical protein [Flavobacteriales bacterium]